MSAMNVYQGGRIAYETDEANTILATFAYDSGGTPTSVQVGSDPSSAPRYYYVYNWHGDVVALVDSSGNAVASYSYDAFGAVQTDTDNFGNGWHNPYLYDGKDRYYYDAETALYWLSVRAYDPSMGRFISRDPLGRTPLMGLKTQPYVYGDNNPQKNVDPSGQFYYVNGETPAESAAAVRDFAQYWRVYNSTPHKTWHSCDANPNDTSPTCKRWRAWEQLATQRRDQIVAGLGIAATALTLLGAAVTLVGSVVLLNGLSSDLADAAPAIAKVLAVLAFLGTVVMRLPQPWAGLLGGIVSFLAGLANMISAVDKLWWADAAVSMVLDGTEAAVEGPLAFAMDALTASGGFALIALGFGLIGQASADDALSSQLAAAPPVLFCDVPLVCAGLPPQPPSGYMAY